jgi:hypothetical protein
MQDLGDFICSLAWEADGKKLHGGARGDTDPLLAQPDKIVWFHACLMSPAESTHATEYGIMRRKAPVYDSPNFRGGSAASHLCEVLKPPTVPFRQTPRPNDIRIHASEQEIETTPILVFCEKQDACALKLLLMYYCAWGLHQDISYSPRPTTEDSYGVLARNDNRAGNLVFKVQTVSDFSLDERILDCLTPTARIFIKRFTSLWEGDDSSRRLSGTMHALICTLFCALRTAPTRGEGYQATAFTTTPFPDNYCVISTNIARGSAWGISLVSSLAEQGGVHFLPTNTVPIPAHPTPTPSVSFANKCMEFHTTTGLTFDTFAVPESADARIISGLLPANFTVA